MNRTEKRVTKCIGNGDPLSRLVLQHLADQVHQLTLFNAAGHHIRLQ